MDKTHSAHSNTYAAIDLGSNSFHLAIGSLSHGELRWQQRISEKVQLALGIDEYNHLDDASKNRALACLNRFKKMVSQIPPENLKIVGTNALRIIRDNDHFLFQIEHIFNKHVDIISGREEARLIYLGVSHTNPASQQSRLVIDIGGGSTEFIIGQQFSALLTESLHMGCVTFKKKYFSNGQLNQSNFNQAISASQQQVQHISKKYQKQGWETALGTSGSVKSIFSALQSINRQTDVITLQDLTTLVDHLIHCGHIENIKLSLLKPERHPIFPSGLSILIGAMKQLNIAKLHYSEGALKEGLIYDLLGRLEPENVRKRTIDALLQRYNIDVEQATRVQNTTKSLYEAARESWPEIAPAYCEAFLYNAAQLHEIGITMSHTQFHKHGAYIVTHSDLAGFSRQDQLFLASLIRLHRRKFSLSTIDTLPQPMQNQIKKLALILRLAVLLNHGRHINPTTLTKKIQINTTQTNNDHLHLAIDLEWLKRNPLMTMDLEIEAELLKKAHITLSWDETSL